MAKYFNNIVKTGKVAGSVFSVRNGVTIERAYQPVVYNPKTQLQVEARAKMKLMSQLSAVLGPYIAFRRDGIVSARNNFTKENYKVITFSDGAAQVDMLSLKLTKSVVALPTLITTRSQYTATVSLNSNDADINRVVYVAVLRQTDETARVITSQVVEKSDSNLTFSAELTLGVLASVVVYAYGIRDNSEDARVAFSDMTVSASYVASVVSTRFTTDKDVTLTETVAVEVPAAQG